MTGPLPTPDELAAAGRLDPEAPDAEQQLRHLRTIAARGGRWPAGFDEPVTLAEVVAATPP